MRFLATGVVALILSPPALANSGRFVVDGGTAGDQATIRQALDASSFDFSRLPPIQVYVVPSLAASETAVSTPGRIWFTAAWLDQGKSYWGTIQHEFAHEVDFLILTDAQREQARQLLAAPAWYDPALSHDQQGRERFASMLAWTFWRDREWNNQSPRYKPIEAGADSRAFRQLLTSWGLVNGPKMYERRAIDHFMQHIR